jgi:hypothetical protein
VENRINFPETFIATIVGGKKIVFGGASNAFLLLLLLFTLLCKNYFCNFSLSVPDC